jgi:serine/tyrosine/threonine adenylyltransferase
MTLTLTFDNRFTSELAADPSADPGSRQVTGAAFSRVTPRPPSAPRVLAVSAEMLEVLGIDPEEARSHEFAHVFTGSRVPDGADPHAAAYGGHQFGNWAGQLGDGRAISLGSAIAVDGSRLELQLKGAGPTPYSRRADGLAVLRSSLREFVCSEAMHHLGVPTTRALSLALTGDVVMRDMFYDGNPEWEPGAVVCRVAPSFIRFGNFQLHTWRNETDHLRALADHTIRHHFPELEPGDVTGMYAEVVHRTALLMVEWARVGFVHGVMNTDNMSILGLTIDYGPYGWLEGYDPGWTPNTTDAQGRRYRFGNQPAIAQWNLAQLGNALVPLLDSPAPLQEALDGFVTTFERGWTSMMTVKLGLAEFDRELVDDLLALLGMAETDMTIFFRNLAEVTSAEMGRLEEAHYAAPSEAVLAATQAWLTRWLAAVTPEGRARMNMVNPKYVFRNYLAQEAIDLATAGDPTRIDELLDVLRRPYDDQPGREHFAARRPEWARVKPGCSMLSCSS